MGMLFFFFGINWQTVETKYKHSPMKALAVLYICNFIGLNAIFTSPIWFQFVLGVLHMVCVYFGTSFQCIGLTGGIATGKSSVSQILEENNFSIIDCDKISREVSTMSHFLMRASSLSLGLQGVTQAYVIIKTYNYYS
jgi:hypothetical protein